MRSFERDLAAWFDERVVDLPTDPSRTLGEEVGRLRAIQAVMYGDGWLLWGWPEEVGGLGGSPLLRAVAGEQLVARTGVSETVFSLIEILGPAIAEHAPELGAEHLPPLLRGEVGWCQGFSEPDAGSDLASLQCRAVPDGDDYLITGQKIWTSFAQFATYCIVLARTGEPEQRHRGITAFFVDMDAPGVTVRPLRAINGSDEFAETHFDHVRVPAARVVGEPGGGWRVAMSILRGERGGIFWMRSGWLLDRLDALVSEAAAKDPDIRAVGSAYLSIAGLRARSWTTQHGLADGSLPSTATSIDKVLMGESEQQLFDLARELRAGELEFGWDDAAAQLRSEYMYSRAGTIYGGTAEVQRNIIAEHVIGLPKAPS